MRTPGRLQIIFTLSALLLGAAVFGQDAVGARPAASRPAASGPSAPQVGDVAPLFKLKTLDGEGEFELASLRGKRPVVLFFGSYT